MSPIKHIAIIPDGNRRWAQKKGKAPWEGHLEGAKRIEEIIEALPEIGLNYLTIWGSSYDNLTKRSKLEISTFEKIYKSLAEKALKSEAISRKGLRINFLGEYDKLLSQKTIDALKKTESYTSANKTHTLTCLIGYNGDREMIAAISRVIALKIPNVSRETFGENLWTGHLPPVDIVIRTGKDPHLSNGFMMWQTQNAAIHFSDKMWPEFRKEDLVEVIEQHSGLEKRLGK